MDGTYYLVRKDGRKIVLNGNTARFGTMFLKVVKRPIFRGKNINHKYNIVSNPYKTKEQIEIGNSLSVISG